MEEVFQAPQVAAGRGRETMLAPPEVQKMLALNARWDGGPSASAVSRAAALTPCVSTCGAAAGGRWM